MLMVTGVLVVAVMVTGSCINGDRGVRAGDDGGGAGGSGGSGGGGVPHNTLPTLVVAVSVGVAAGP